MRQLQTPGLFVDQYKQVQQALSSLGEPKVYRTGDPKPGAIDPGPMPQDHVLPDIDLEHASASSLAGFPQTQLVRLAHKLGLEVQPTDSKAHVIRVILEQQ